MTKLPEWLAILFFINLKVVSLNQYKPSIGSYQNDTEDTPSLLRSHLEKENIRDSNEEDNGDWALQDSKHLTRNARSVTSIRLPAPQLKQLCGGFGTQPCTCYYPDHPNVILFELDTDETTKNASNLNGTGPASCEDLRAMGYKLSGFYFVRFKPKRVKATYCDFHQPIENLSSGKSTASISLLKQVDDVRSPEMAQFCKGLVGQPCTFLYPDYPDIPLLHKKRYTISHDIELCENCILGPTSCGDLKIIGHRLEGFYMIRLNANKVKIIFCDFNEINENTNENLRAKQSIFQKDGTTPSKNAAQICRGVGSQPCSCYFSNSKDILQFEMSDDEITRNAMLKTGTGPETCEELKQIGYELDGFYMLRLNSISIKTTYCKLNEIKIKNNNGGKDKNELTTVEPMTSTKLETDSKTSPTEIKNIKKARTEMANIELTSSLLEITESTTAVYTTKTEKPECDSYHQVFHLKNEDQGFCLVMEADSSLSLSKCDISSLNQHWIKLKSSYRGMFISIDYDDDSTTVSPSTTHKRKKETRLTHLRPRFNTSSNHQQWALSKKTGQLWNVASELCLVAYSKNQKKSAANLKVGIETCLEIPTKSHKWSFMRFQDESNNELCFSD